MNQAVPDISNYAKESLSPVSEEKSLFYNSGFDPHHKPLPMSQLSCSNPMTSAAPHFHRAPMGERSQFPIEAENCKRISFHSDWSSEEEIKYSNHINEYDAIVPEASSSPYLCPTSFPIKAEVSETEVFQTICRKRRASNYEINEQESVPHLRPHDFNPFKSNSHHESFGGVYAQERDRTLVPADPRSWGPCHVMTWVMWVAREYGLQHVDPYQFTHTDGNRLCSMTLEDFNSYTSEHNSEILLQHLKLLMQASSSYSSGAKLDQMTSLHSSTTEGFSNSKQNRHLNRSNISLEEVYKLLGPLCVKLYKQGGGQIQLWQFLMELLSEQSNSTCIAWENINGEFKMVDPDEVARRWGERKSKPNMNYDKMSRALRYYYDKNIMTKVHGKRYAYKFDFHGLAQSLQSSPDPERCEYHYYQEHQGNNESLQWRTSFPEPLHQSSFLTVPGYNETEGPIRQQMGHQHTPIINQSAFERNSRNSRSDTSSVASSYYGYEPPSTASDFHGTAPSCERSSFNSSLRKNEYFGSFTPSSGSSWEESESLVRDGMMCPHYSPHFPQQSYKDPQSSYPPSPFSYLNGDRPLQTFHYKALESDTYHGALC